MNNTYNPNTDLNFFETQRLIAQCKGLSADVVAQNVDAHINTGCYPCWVEDLSEYRTAVMDAINAD